jgi:hypothetical protein
MKIRLLLYGVAIVCASLFAMNALTQEKKAKEEMKPQAGGQMDPMMKKWMEAATPGENHKRLDDMVGTWEATSTAWMDPAKPPSITKGTSEIKWVLGGRFLQQDFTGEMMGMPFNGMGLTGYDNFNKKYIGSWVDNTSTAMLTMEGTADPTGKVITMLGKSDDPGTGEHGKAMKYVARLVSKDKHVFEIYDLSMGNKETKLLEISYTRKK